MPSNIAYPWFYFYRIARLSLLVFLPTLLGICIVIDDRLLIFKILPIASVGYLCFIIFFYYSTKPLGVVMAKLQKYRKDLPFDKTLKHLYLRDEWVAIEEALNKADQQLQLRVVEVRNENEKIHAILESINDSIIAIDSFETVLFYNTNFKRNFFKSSSEGSITPRLWHTFSEEDILATFRSVLKSSVPRSLKSFKSGGRYFDLTVTPLKNLGALGVFYDVTDFKLTEQMRVDFVANVSHEIRTPLTSIRGYTQLLQTQKSLLSNDYAQFLDKIVSNTERMIHLFNDLLNLSVIESKHLERFEELNIDSIIEAVTDNITTNYADKNLNIELDLKLKTIYGDHRLMEQVLSNLIDNACKYSGNDIHVKISTYQKGQFGYIMVADSGPGISPEHLQRIFERFYRIESSRETMRGTGLGLSIVKHIIGKHGGRIWAESDQSRRGTAFFIELPLKQIL